MSGQAERNAKRNVRVIGAPTKAETAKLMDQDKAPAAIRAAYANLMAGFNIPAPFDDAGDLHLSGDMPAVLAEVQNAIENTRRSGSIPVLLGGAHTITLGTLRALAKTDREFSLIYIDAHPDLMPRQEFNYGSSIYHALQEKVITPKRVAFIGIRHVEQEEEEIITQQGIFARTAVDIAYAGIKQTVDQLITSLPPPYVISLDFDAIDPAFAPGVTLPYPAGVTPREVLGLVQHLAKHGIICLELMELSPANDPDGRTLALAGEFLYRTTKALAR